MVGAALHAVLNDSERVLGMKVGDRVTCDFLGSGTVTDMDPFKGQMTQMMKVKFDNDVPKEYCFTSTNDVLVLKEWMEEVK